MAMLNCVRRARRRGQTDDIDGREPRGVDWRAVHGAKAGFCLIVFAPYINAITARQCRGKHPVQVLEVAGDGRPARILIVDQSTETDLIYSPERLGDMQGRRRRRAHQPLVAEHDGCGVGRVHVGGDFRGDLEYPGGNAQVRHAALLGETQAGQGMIHIEDHYRADRLITKAEVIGSGIGHHRLRVTDSLGSLLGLGKIATADQQGDVWMLGTQRRSGVLTDGSRATHQ